MASFFTAIKPQSYCVRYYFSRQITVYLITVYRRVMETFVLKKISSTENWWRNDWSPLVRSAFRDRRLPGSSDNGPDCHTHDPWVWSRSGQSVTTISPQTYHCNHNRHSDSLWKFIYWYVLNLIEMGMEKGRWREGEMKREEQRENGWKARDGDRRISGRNGGR